MAAGSALSHMPILYTKYTPNRNVTSVHQVPCSGRVNSERLQASRGEARQKEVTRPAGLVILPAWPVRSSQFKIRAQPVDGRVRISKCIPVSIEQRLVPG